MPSLTSLQGFKGSFALMTFFIWRSPKTLKMLCSTDTCYESRTGHDSRESKETRVSAIGQQLESVSACDEAPKTGVGGTERMPNASLHDHLSGQPLISEFLFCFSHEKTSTHSGNIETLASSATRSWDSTKPHPLPVLKRPCVQTL